LTEGLKGQSEETLHLFFAMSPRDTRQCLSAKGESALPGAAATFFRCLSLAVLLLARAPAAHGWQAPAAEKPAEPNLDEILRHLENNFIQYHASIPSFFCDEHVVSGIRRGSTPLEVIRADSIFRLKREGSGKRTRLIESREIKTVNGKPAKESEALRGPALLSGAFNIATAMIAYDEKPCFTYRLSESRRHHQYVIEYATKTPNQRDKRCAVTEPTSGRAFVDPATMQITRIEARTPHILCPASSLVFGPGRSITAKLFSTERPSGCRRRSPPLPRAISLHWIGAISLRCSGASMQPTASIMS